jgi:uncharacterized lipoprotein YehR (DUF1307 family)
MKKLLLLILLFTGISCSIKKDDNNTISQMVDSINIQLEIHYKNDAIIRKLDFEYGYQLAYHRMLLGKFKSYADFEKQWKIDSTRFSNMK